MGSCVQKGEKIDIAEEGPIRLTILHTTDMHSRMLPYDMDVIAPEGRGTHAFRLALNDPAGTWTFVLEDVATGTTRKVDLPIQLP